MDLSNFGQTARKLDAKVDGLRRKQNKMTGLL
jgi:hypothetical protein